jgi:NADH-quinone oxidoreductase subunit A
VSFFFVRQNPDSEKYSSYECGFNPFEDARTKFEIHFYLVGILFIIFDLEVIFLFPWVVVFYKLSTFGAFIMLFFIIILTIGFAYEWVKKALDWE